MGFFSTYFAKTSQTVSGLHRYIWPIQISVSHNCLLWCVSTDKMQWKLMFLPAISALKPKHVQRNTVSDVPRQVNFTCTIFSTVNHSQSLVSTQEAEPPVTSAVCNGDLEAKQGEHVRPLLPVQSCWLVCIEWSCYWLIWSVLQVTSVVLSCSTMSINSGHFKAWKWFCLSDRCCLWRGTDFKVEVPCLFSVAPL